MSATVDKVRALRLQRLRSMLEERLENPSAALEALVSELVAGEAHTSSWEGLHAAAARDGLEQALAGAYQKLTTERRLQQLEPRARVDVLMHAADFHQGVLGDAATTETLLERVLEIVPDHREAFARLERRFESTDNPRGLIRLYAIVAASDPRSKSDLVSKAVNKIVPLPAKAPLSEDTCKRLMALVPSHPILLGVLEAHCRKTSRIELACSLIEQAILVPDAPKPTLLEQRQLLVKLYTGEGGKPAGAISHVEALLEENPLDATARAAAERLLSTREVAARAAAALQKARRQMRAPK